MTKIEWTEKTWNPIVGCSIVSPGCTNCYAMRMAARLEAMGTTQFPHYAGTTKPSKAGPVWTGEVALASDQVLTQPLSRKKPTTYFVNSMGDLFHKDVPDEWIDRVFAVMALSPQHTFQVLTKRSARMRAYCDGMWARREELGNLMGQIGGEERAGWYAPESDGKRGWEGMCVPLPNVWLGVSTERQQEADERIPDLLNTPAAVRFVSAEPLIGPVDLSFVGDAVGPSNEPDDDLYRYDALTGRALPWAGVIGGIGVWATNKARPCPALDWVIVGGESGPGARPMHPDWAREIRDQCKAADVPFFFKQWGDWRAEDAGFSPQGGIRLPWGLDQPAVQRVGKAYAGRLLDGREHNDTPSASGSA